MITDFKNQAGFMVKRIFNHSLIMYLFLFLVLLFRSWPYGLETRFVNGAIGLFDTSLQLESALGGADAAQLLNVAHTWSNFQMLNPDTQGWIARTWSLGFSVIQVPLIWLQKLGIPFLVSLTILSCLLWSFFLGKLWRALQDIVSNKYRFFIFFVLICSWDFTFMFRDYIFNSESIGLVLVLIPLFLLSLSIIRDKKLEKIEVISLGSSLGMGVWVRYSSDYGMLSLFFLSIIGFAVYKKLSQIKKSQKKRTHFETISQKIYTKKFKSIIIVTLIGILITLPSRLATEEIYQGHRLKMSSALALAGPNLWAPTDSPHAKYWSSYGMNWACKIDEQLCLKISKNPAQYKNQLNLAIGAALTNPIEYTNERLKFFIQNWFPEDKGTIDFLISIIFILIPFYTVYYVIRIRDKRKHLVTLLWVPFITWQLIAYTLVHYERRYFIPFHFFTFCYFLSAIILKKSEDLSKSRTLS